MREINVVAEPRTDIGTGPAKRLRRAGRVPGTVYGLEDPAISITVDGHEIQQVLSHGANALINLEVGGDSQLTMTREVQRHPVRGDVLHVDFVRIRADQPVQAEVPIHLTGEPEGAKEGGVLEHVLYTVTVSAKPRDLPEAIELDVSDLGVNEQKRAGDVVAPTGVEILNDPEQVVAALVVPALEEAGPTLSGEEAAELEGLSEEELEQLKELAAARAEGEAPAEGEEGEGEEAAPEGGAEDE